MKEAGFTLIEVLAAMLIFSVAIIGLTHAGTQSIRAVSHIEEKTLAAIVVDNQLVLARQDRLEVGAVKGESRLMSRNYIWERRTSETDISGFFRLVITVRQEGQEQVLIERTAFRSLQ